MSLISEIKSLSGASVEIIWNHTDSQFFNFLVSFHSFLRSLKIWQIAANFIRHVTTYFAQFLKYHFYDLKVTFGYIGESPENFMPKYTQEVF